jgi:signal transduction histidine kinase
MAGRREAGGSKRSGRSAGATSAATAERDASLWLTARHDFGQPAQSLELLARGLERADSPDERRQYANAIAQVAASLGEMVNGMSLVARLEGGEARPSPRQTDVCALISETLDALAPAIAQSHGRIIFEPGATRVLSDRALLGAVLRGLVLYVIRLCDAGEIQLEVVPRGRRIAIVATLEGRHSDSALASGAFVELAPQGGPGSKPLVGLGPALAARVARQMGGGLVLDQVRDGRARVTLTLPAPPVDQP